MPAVTYQSLLTRGFDAEMSGAVRRLLLHIGQIKGFDPKRKPADHERWGRKLERALQKIDAVRLFVVQTQTALPDNDAGWEHDAGMLALLINVMKRELAREISSNTTFLHLMENTRRVGDTYQFKCQTLDGMVSAICQKANMMYSAHRMGCLMRTEETKKLVEELQGLVVFLEHTQFHPAEQITVAHLHCYISEFGRNSFFFVEKKMNFYELLKSATMDMAFMQTLRAAARSERKNNAVDEIVQVVVERARHLAVNVPETKEEEREWLHSARRNYNRLVCIATFANETGYVCWPCTDFTRGLENVLCLADHLKNELE